MTQAKSDLSGQGVHLLIHSWAHHIKAILDHSCVCDFSHVLVVLRTEAGCFISGAGDLCGVEPRAPVSYLCSLSLQRTGDMQFLRTQFDPFEGNWLLADRSGSHRGLMSYPMRCGRMSSVIAEPASYHRRVPNLCVKLLAQAAQALMWSQQCHTMASGCCHACRTVCWGPHQGWGRLSFHPSPDRAACPLGLHFPGNLSGASLM